MTRNRLSRSRLRLEGREQSGFPNVRVATSRHERNQLMALTVDLSPINSKFSVRLDLMMIILKYLVGCNYEYLPWNVACVGKYLDNTCVGVCM